MTCTSCKLHFPTPTSHSYETSLPEQDILLCQSPFVLLSSKCSTVFHSPALTPPSTSSLRATAGPTSIQTSGNGLIVACRARGRRSPGTLSHHSGNSHHPHLNLSMCTLTLSGATTFKKLPYLLTCISHYTCCLEAQPMPDITADCVVRAFMTNG